MNVAALFLHLLGTEPCPGWVARDCTPETKERIDAIFSKHLESVQPSGFNYWIVVTDNEEWVIARRWTWDMAHIGGTWEKLEQELAEYYEEYER